MFTYNYPRIYYQKAVCPCGSELVIEAFHKEEIEDRNKLLREWKQEHRGCSMKPMEKKENNDDQ